MRKKGKHYRFHVFEIKLKSWRPDLIKLQFIWAGNKSIHTIFKHFDLDCCECGFTGETVLCSQRFTQSINTRTMSFFLHPQYYSDVELKRIIKYYLRGFDLVLPPTYVTCLYTY